ncbi:MAG: DegT/DnrJ/EryC1/StrS family aminotransferase [Steroidobacteraceae bacterium]
MTRQPPARLQVPLLDLKLQYRSLKADLDAALLAVAESQQFILGQSVLQLEERVAAYCGARFGVGVSSGTDALLVSLMALDIGAGDAVVTTPYTFFATAGAIARVGARPLFVDIDPGSFNIDPGGVERFLEQECGRRSGALVHRASGCRVRALVPVHLYGQAADMDRMTAAAARHGLAVIEDAAQAIGAEFRGRRVGSIGDLGCLSFFPTKNLGAFGDAGLVTTNDEALAAKLRMLRVHGMEPRYCHSLIGGNFRLDELQAAVLLVKLARLDTWTTARQRNAARYEAAIRRAGLGDRVRLPGVAGDGRHVFNQFVVRADARDALRAWLAEAGVGTEIYYPVPLHLQRCFSALGYGPGSFPESERAALETLALPIYPELSDVQLQHVVDTMAAFYS